MSRLYIHGPLIYIKLDANSLSNNNVNIALPSGYSFEKIFINEVTNISALSSYYNIDRGDHITFPVVNSKSPSYLPLFIPDLSKLAAIKFTIEKFGKIPDSHYFDKEFEPTLVLGGGNNNYTAIPSDQFK